MRNLSATAKAEIFKSQSSEVFIVLLTISHSSFDDICVTSDMVTTTSNGINYVPYPFEISLPDENSERLSVVKLAIDNIDRMIIQKVRAVNTPVTVQMNIVLASDPNSVEIGPYTFTLRNIDYDAYSIEGDLMYEDILNEPYPAPSYTPQDYRGLFQ